MTYADKAAQPLQITASARPHLKKGDAAFVHGYYGVNDAAKMVCWSCRKIYKSSKHHTYTTRCSHCGEDLIEVPRWFLVPKRSDVKGWEKARQSFYDRFNGLSWKVRDAIDLAKRWTP